MAASIINNRAHGDDIRRVIAEQSQISTAEISQIIEIYCKDGQFRGNMRTIWTRFRPAIEAYVRGVWDHLISDVHMLNTEQRLGRKMTRAEVVEGATKTSLAPFHQNNEQKWMAECAVLTVESWMAGEDGRMLKGISDGNSALMTLLLPQCESDDERALVVNTLVRLTTMQSEIIHRQRVQLERRKMLFTIGDDSQRYRDALLDLMQNAKDETGNLRQSATNIVASAIGVVGKSTEVSAVTKQSATAMQDAAQISAGLVQVIERISERLEEAEKTTLIAATQSEEAVAISADLLVQAQTIESILGFIRDLAGQTNLLALNATIEAARAGSAGQGFAVVAQEVKSLASQTDLATNDIADKVQMIQHVTQQASQKSRVICDAILDVKDKAATILSDVHEQSRIVSDISAAIDETALAATSNSKLVSAIHVETEAMVERLRGLAGGFERVDTTLNQANQDARSFVNKLSELS